MSEHRVGREHWLDLFSTLLLSLATVATAWSGYQAARWHGEQAEAQTKATASRLESTRESGLANRELQVDVALFIQWVDAHQTGDDELARFYRARFTDRFRPAFDAWIADRPFTTRGAPGTPFATPEYKLAASRDAEQLDTKATAATEEAREDIQRADNYVLAVVLFAASLFFAGISTKLRTHGSRTTILVLGWVVFLGTLVWIATFPVTISV